MTRSARGPASPFGPRFLTPLLIGAAANPINSSIIATALVSIGHAFEVSATQTATLVAAVYLASAVAQPAMGKLANRFGARRVFIAGLVIVTVAGVIGTVAPAFWWLVVSRVLIGIGTSAGFPTAMTIIRTRADQHGIGVPSGVLGAMSIAAQLTIALGLPLGGVLVGVWGWRAVFAVNILVGVVGIVFALLWVPADTRDHRTDETLVVALDPLGMVLFSGAVLALLSVLTDLTAPVWWMIALFVAAVAALIGWERRARDPFIDVRMLAANGPLVRTYLRNALTVMATYCVLYGMTQWMEQARGLSPTVVGLVTLPMTVVGAALSAVVARRRAVRTPLALSGAAILVGAALLWTVDASSSILLLVVLTSVFGLVNGFSNVSNQVALYGQTTAEQIGVASGLLRTANYIGAIFASSVIAIAFGQVAGDAGLRVVAAIFAGLGVAVILLASLDRAIPRHAV